MCWADFVAFKDGQSHAKETKMLIKEHVRVTSPAPGTAGDTEGLKEALRESLKESAKNGESSDRTPSFLGLSAEWDIRNETEDTLSSLRHYPSPLLTKEPPTMVPLPPEKKSEPPPPEPIKPPAPTKKRRPLMRAKTELSLGRNRSSTSIFSLLSDRVLQPDKSPVKPTITEDKPSLEEEISMQTLPQTTVESSNTEKPVDTGLDGVEKTLEEALDSVQAALAKNETKRREAVWDLFQSECAFLYDHLMVLKNVS